MRKSARTLMMTVLISLLSLAAALAAGATTEGGGAVPQVPVKGMVTMVDLGAKSCIPCKMMAPIMVELEKEYKDRAAIVFIDVWQNPGEAGKFGISSIPTQIFYDASGKERQRHVGFLDKASIVKILADLGVK